MDARTTELALREIRLIEASLDAIQRDLRETVAIADRIIAKLQRAIVQPSSIPSELPRRT
jgi:hypothetical protein